MDTLRNLTMLLIFPGGLGLLFMGLMIMWADRKLIARFQNRVGPRWFQPIADSVKLLAKEEVTPAGTDKQMFNLLPLIALGGALTAALYVPLFGINPAFSFNGDLIVTLYMLSLLTLCIGLAGSNTTSRFSVVGAVRSLTQLFAYEVPFLLAMLGPALVAGSWQISDITAYSSQHLLILTQPIGFVIALVGLMGKLEMPPFDAPEAETEIVAGSLTEYSGRGLALFRLGQGAEFIIGLTLVAAFYLGGLVNPVDFLIKTLGLLFFLALLQSVMTRFRIDQTVGVWWRYGALAVLAQWFLIIVMEVA